MRRGFPFWPYPLDPTNPRNKNEAGFWGVQAAKPWIYTRMDQEVWVLIGQGRDCHAVDHFFDSIRWNGGLSMDPPEEFKMNNNYRPYYARYWLQNNPAYWGFFELRRVRGEYPWKGVAVELI